jgi:lysophospholipase L1-like esterase
LLQGRSPGRSVRAINRGLPGANSAELADRLERELRELPRRPDLVLLTCCANNIWNLHDCPLLKAGESPPGGQQWLAKVQSLQAGKLASIIGLTGADALARIAAEPTWRPYGFFHTDAPVPALDPSNPAEREFLRRWAREDVRRMAAAVAGAGAKLVLAGYHEGAQLVPVDDAAREAGAVVCDEPWMGRAWGGLGLLSADGWHPNDRGYAAFAAHVAQCLVRHKLWRAEEQAPR